MMANGYGRSGSVNGARVVAPAAILALAVVLAGCGGDGSTVVETVEPPEVHTGVLQIVVSPDTIAPAWLLKRDGVVVATGHGPGTVDELAAGNYRFEYGGLTGWAIPNPYKREFTLNETDPHTVTAVYTPVALADQPWGRIEAGTFAIGSPPDEAARDTDEDRYDNTFTRPYLMLATEVTQSLYTAFSDTNPSHYLGDNAHPVDSVSWYDAVAFCNRLSAAAGLTAAYVIDGTDVTWDPDADGYRLPTEAEWEHACRAGTTTRYSSGDSWDNLRLVGWVEVPYGGTRPVAQKPANPWGLYDMHGNVQEYVWDVYGPYPTGAATDFAGPATGTTRIFRGGAYSTRLDWCRTAFRNMMDASTVGWNTGFRIVRYAD